MTPASHALSHGGLAPDIDTEVAKLEQADLIILSVPMFWFSVPAIMKGWIDRVLVVRPVLRGAEVL